MTDGLDSGLPALAPSVAARFTLPNQTFQWNSLLEDRFSITALEAHCLDYEYE
ncbi:hypothetical protein [Synechococcus sp. PCC 7336]|uniref:hypothetical protein n=1 Tax=Synechococcus sp. PCC 7336 TaxID=195250 RepID=UPI00037D24B1|nr:hypothetical protein [Synechococcus sp. PCC 7336]